MISKLMYWLMQFSIFLLRGAGWVAVGVVIGFIVSFFFRPAGRVDTFAFTETMLGVIVTGLSIVGAFTIALQWSNLDRRVHEFDVKVKETTDFFDKQAERMEKVAQDTDAHVQSTLDAFTRNYGESISYLDELLRENAKTALEINSKVDEYKAFYEQKANEYEERAKEIDEKQKEFGKIVADYRTLIEKVGEVFALKPGDEHPGVEEPATGDG